MALDRAAAGQRLRLGEAIEQDCVFLRARRLSAGGEQQHFDDAVDALTIEQRRAVFVPAAILALELRVARGVGGFDPAFAVEHLEQALLACRGVALAGVAEAWGDVEAVQLRHAVVALVVLRFAEELRRQRAEQRDVEFARALCGLDRRIGRLGGGGGAHGAVAVCGVVRRTHRGR